MKAARNSRNSRLFASSNASREPVEKSAPVKEQKTEEVVPYFVNAMGRPLESLGVNAVELALEIGNLVDWDRYDLYRDEDDGLSSRDIFDFACRVGEAILNKYPKATVLCQSDWGFTIALASYIAAHGGRPEYAKALSYDSPLYRGIRELGSYVEFKFPKVGRGRRFREYSPDQILLNLSSHSKTEWYPRSRYLGYGFERTVDAVDTTMFDYTDIDQSRVDFEAFAYYIRDNVNASEAVVTGEWSYVAAVVPLLIEAGIRVKYPVMYYNGYMTPDGRPCKSFYRYREYRFYRPE